mgnify:CR=1 FL=1
MGQAKTTYVTAQDLTITIASLASDTNLLIGRQSNEWDNTTNGYRDAWVSGKITTGTTPTAGSIEVWAVGYNGTSYADAFSTADAARTISSAVIKQGVCRLVAQFANTTTSNAVHEFGPRLLSDVFMGDVPQKVVFFVTHSSVAALNATAANHFLRIQPVYDLF